MAQWYVRATIQLTRADTSLLVFASVFIPLLLQRHDLSLALAHGLPLLTSVACTFVLNDVSDVEKDKINHPDRPLASLRVSKEFAISLYFFLLLSSIVLIKLLIDIRLAFFYVAFLILITNYDHVVLYFPRVKNVYVSAATIFPVLILRLVSQEEKPYGLISVALFFYIFSRELLMDDLDRNGDNGTLVKGLSPRQIVRLALIIQIVTIGSLYFAITQSSQYWLYAISMTTVATGVYLWRVSKEHLSLFVMKVTMLFGIAFLV